VKRAWRPLAAVVAGLAGLVACGGEPEKPVDQRSALGGEVAARAGREVVPLALVARTASASGLSPREALRRLVDDAVAADAARSRGLDAEAPAAWLLEAARGRFTADRALADARASGPPTDDEVREAAKAHWREVDRPPAARVVHALAMPKKKGEPATDAEARAVAASIASAVQGATSADDFKARASAVPRPPEITVVVESLPATSAEGMVTEGGGGEMDRAFSRAANALTKPGDVSPVVESEKFGWHVIYLVERVPEQRMAFEDQRVAFASEIYARRARATVQAIVAERQKRAKVVVLPSAEGLMRSVVVESGKPAAP
jgi:peptidyl-prolyl cis-trans isomerase C